MLTTELTGLGTTAPWGQVDPRSLPPGTYTLTYQTPNRKSTRQLRLEWTGSAWRPLKSGHSDRHLLNLQRNSWLNEPFVVTKMEKGKDHPFSPFSLDPLRLTAEFMILKRGFLPGEHLTFELTLRNCIHGSVRKLSVSIYQQTVHSEDQSEQEVTRLIGKEQIPNGVGHVGRGEIFWGSELRLPSDLAQSSLTWEDPLEDQNSIQVSYFIQFNVEMMDKKPGLRGQTAIFIRAKSKLIR